MGAIWVGHEASRICRDSRRMISYRSYHHVMLTGGIVELEVQNDTSSNNIRKQANLILVPLPPCKRNSRVIYGRRMVSHKSYTGYLQHQTSQSVM
jgi:hypothetical protein